MTYAQTTQDIKAAVFAIRQGRVVAFPTGTSYGLAADVLQGHSLQRLRNLKQRPDGKTFSIFLTPSLHGKYLKLTDDEERYLAENTNQPVTLLVKSKSSLEHLARDGLIGLRIIDHPLMQELADAAGVPLTATSANISGRPPCYTPTCVLDNFPGKLDATTYDLSLALILDGGQLPHRPTSTIVKLQPHPLPQADQQGAQRQ
ncbi:MAG: L-threonylcarbamoyladenylate synthase [bacterium]